MPPAGDATQADAAKPAATETPDPLKTRFDELARRERLATAERRRVAVEKQAIDQRTKELESRLAEAEKLKGLFDRAKVDVDGFHKAVYGDNWFEQVNEFKLNGTPPGVMIQSAVDERLSALRRELDDKAKAEKESAAKERARQDAQENVRFAKRVAEHVNTNAEAYPLIGLYEAHASVLTEIENHFKATAKRNEDGTFEPGEILSAKAAAEAVEKRLSGLIAKAEEWKAKKANPGAKGETVKEALQRTAPTLRRTLSTDITASATSSKPPPVDDNERMRRAIAVWDAKLAQRA